MNQGTLDLRGDDTKSIIDMFKERSREENVNLNSIDLPDIPTQPKANILYQSNKKFLRLAGD